MRMTNLLLAKSSFISGLHENDIRFVLRVLFEFRGINQCRIDRRAEYELNQIASEKRDQACRPTNGKSSFSISDRLQEINFGSAVSPQEAGVRSYSS
ncbi:hypothetical protein TNCV_4856551 [Trichonephila clavipes]|nr:hypothetical protein TNCV_4856551 [Trichonephila clavipes]